MSVRTPRGAKPKVEVFRGKDAMWYWRIRWANGQVAAVSEASEQRGTATMAAQKMALMLNVGWETV